MSEREEKMEYAARTLIEAVGGLMSDNNVAGVIEVFESLVSRVNEDWNNYILKQTEDVLQYNREECTCGRKIAITRSRKTVFLDIYE